MAKRQKKSVTNKVKGEKLYEFLLAKGKEFAKQLKTKATPHEKQFYKILKDLHYKFQFQVPIITNKKHLYILDFLLTEYNIFIELDGSQHNTKAGLKKDNLRTKRLRKEGYEPIRFANKQVVTFTKDQIDTIIKTKIKLLTNPNVV